jgi:hypothetical protein
MSPAFPIQPVRLCSFCGLVRILDGGRPLEIAGQNRCGECGARLSISPEDPAAIVGRAAKCRDAHTSIDAGLR